MAGRVLFVDSESCATVNPCIDLMDDVDGVHLRQLPPLTTLLVWTRNSLYRIVSMEGSNICVQGGTYFPDPTSAHLDGARLGGSCLKVGWIAVGLMMEISAGDRHILTSPVHAIITEGCPALVH
jgi:hypothetical protein